jgi:asparagine synthase (glutamine-hydrolysing)
MCGISGVVGLRASEDLVTVLDMADCLSHRGPDDTNIIKAPDGCAVFAMNTLLIVSAIGQTGPYADPSWKCILTYNGEIYNFRELASSWQISLDEDETDAHFLLKAYLKFGRTCLDHLDGMYAFAIYDLRSRKAILARDRFGEKPLYYSLRRGTLSFASEAKALIHHTTRVNVPVRWFASESFLGEDTPYPDISLLSPGTAVEFRLADESIERHRYWSLESVPRRIPLDFAEATDTYMQLLLSAARRTKPDIPFALMLSGGLDSATLAFLMKPDYLITVRYRGAEHLDEFAKAEAVARKLDIELVCIEPGPDDFAKRAESLVYHLDYPVGNASLFSEFMLYEEVARRGTRVVIGGIGPDELLLGYFRHFLMLAASDTFNEGTAGSYGPMVEKFQRITRQHLPVSEQYARLIHRNSDMTLPHSETVREIFSRTLDVGQALTLTDLAISFPPLVLASDKLASAFGIERRSPYLARELAEFSYSLPVSLKHEPPDHSKLLLREVARRIGVPAEISDCTEKKGFASPLPSWLTGPLAKWCDDKLTLAATDERAPHLVRAAAAKALRAPASPFDRMRMQALLFALWWKRHRAGELDSAEFLNYAEPLHSLMR